MDKATSPANSVTTQLVRHLMLCVPLLFVLPSNGAGMLYKSVNENGTVVFSDTPPPSGTRVLAQQRLPEFGSATAPNAVPAAAGLPVYEFPEYDAEIARANEAVDLAEHALAVARQGLSSARDGLQLVGLKMSQADADRIEFFKKDLKSARRYLVELVQERQTASARRYQLAAR